MFHLPLLLMAGWAGAAHAAKPARVGAESVTIHSDADPASTVLGTAVKDDPLAVSNESFAGFHKVRTGDGKIGWVLSEALNLAPDLGAGGGGGAGSSGASSASASRGLRERDDVLESGFRTLFFGGASFFAPTTVNAVLGITDYRSAFNFGLEAAVDFNDWLALVLRAEYLTGNFVLTDSESLSTYNLGTQGIPLTVGFDWSPVHSSRFRLGIMAGAGVSPITLLYSQALNEGGANVTTYSGLGTAGVARMILELPLSRGFSLFFEGGYRWLVTAAMSPLSTGNGSEIFADPDSGQARAIDLDYSGPLANGGFVFRF